MILEESNRCRCICNLVQLPFGKLVAWLFLVLLIPSACKNNNCSLTPVSYAQFEAFVEETGYVTDAERYGWSIVQVDVFNFRTEEQATWRKPDGLNPPISKDLPVTQVSYNDAMAYCEWAKVRLPTYEEYWDLVQRDRRKIVSNNILPISPIQEVNIVGNVWEITAAEKREGVRLAGGSLFCSPNTCHGTVRERVLYVDKETANIHIGFGVVE